MTITRLGGRSVFEKLLRDVIKLSGSGELRLIDKQRQCNIIQLDVVNWDAVLVPPLIN
jgi:hypothetical protein